MSCRVIGLGVETYVVGEIGRRLRRMGAEEVSAEVTATDANFMCRDLFARCGFEERNGTWILDTKHLGESEATGSDDIALYKPATQSSVSEWSHRSTVEEDAGGANTGLIPPDYAFHTAIEFNPWWQVDLRDEYVVERLIIHNRKACADRFRNFSLLKSADGRHWDLMYQKADDLVVGGPDNLPLEVRLSADGQLTRFVRVRLDDENCLHLRAVQVFGRRRQHRDGTEDHAQAAGSPGNASGESPSVAVRPVADRNNVMSSGFPPEFDPIFYRSAFPDLAHLDDKGLAAHYETWGRDEGRWATTAVPRDRFVQLIPPGRSILEIGPFNNPNVIGEKVKYLDVLPQDQLIERARNIGEDFARVPKIDYVHPFGDLSIVNGQKFDVVISSHSIEHQPDLVRHLQQVEHLLNDDGMYFVIAPDKRYCFDYFIDESSIADIIDAHVSGRMVHTLASIIRHWALTTHNDIVQHWFGDHGAVTDDLSRIEKAIHDFKSYPGSYIDVHAWQFTPLSFRKILTDLYGLHYTKLSPIRVYNTPHGWNEFYAILRKRENL
jgi:SAM-dependent methyltransferase